MMAPEPATARRERPLTATSQRLSVSLLDTVDVSRDHLQSEQWGYTLQHDTRVAYLGFSPHSGVGATMGKRDKAVQRATGIQYRWRIKTATSLELTDEEASSFTSPSN